MRTRIIEAASAFEIASVRALFEEYAASLTIDLCFQGFAAELAALPGAYAPPRGRLLLAVEEGHAAGCVALRPFDVTAGELKRLYVRPAYQGRGLGRTLALRAIEAAREIGYTVLRLDTMASMLPAIRLYESLGFKRCEPPVHPPVPDLVFMIKGLTPVSTKD